MLQKPVSLVAGSSGLVGSLILRNLLSMPGSIISLARKKNNSNKNITEKIINFDDLHKGLVNINEKIDHVYLCLGKRISTYELGYMPKSNRESFKKIDLDYSLEIAKLGLKNGAKSIALVSAIGAEEGSINYYFHIKGKLENSLKNIGYKNICFARPGHLLGEREEFRGYEIPILESALSLAAPFMQGPLMNFRQIEAAKVAEKMVKITTEKEGLSILSYSDFIKRD
tara:strand:+ start:286 stop:966 length:681 start_codon:yes stop_codon:yes gene_type:complete